MTESKNTILTFGTNCRDANHKLIPVSLIDIYNMIREGNKGLIEQTSILRKVLNYSVDRYRDMKIRLPYFCCSHFEPSTRRMDNFSYAVGCIMDIDWKHGMDTTIYNRITTDPRVAMAYISPGGNGAKIVFLFDSPIDNINLYTEVYKVFIHDFARQYKILDVVDFKNSDVSRISFVCYDPEAIFNDDAIPIFVEDYLVQKPAPTQQNKQNELSPDIYKKILAKLETRPVVRRNPVNIPQQVEVLLPFIKSNLAEYDIEIRETTGIQSGAKLKIQLNNDFGEVNIYYGKKGYSCISSPKKGTKHELNEIAKHIIINIFPIRYFE